MNISTALAYYSKKLFSIYNNEHTALSVTWWLLEKALQKNRTALLLIKDISPEALQQLETWISALIDDHMPVQYILGSVPFIDLDITVQAPILIPRPETEQWCQELITSIKKSTFQSLNLLDLCSGTGCIALSIAHALSDADVTALDINPQACELITLNKENNRITNCRAVESDLFEKLSHEKKYSVIAANPPYITQAEWHSLEPRVKKWESFQALVASDDGLEIIEKIIYQARDYLDTPLPECAQLWIEIGELQAERVRRIFEKAGYKDIRIRKDFYGKDRVVTGSL